VEEFSKIMDRESVCLLSISATVRSIRTHPFHLKSPIFQIKDEKIVDLKLFLSSEYFSSIPTCLCSCQTQLGKISYCLNPYCPHFTTIPTKTYCPNSTIVNMILLSENFCIYTSSLSPLLLSSCSTSYQIQTHSISFRVHLKLDNNKIINSSNGSQKRSHRILDDKGSRRPASCRPLNSCSCSCSFSQVCSCSGCASHHAASAAGRSCCRRRSHGLGADLGRNGLDILSDRIFLDPVGPAAPDPLGRTVAVVAVR
jgi:hypothetical protein